MSSKRAFRHPRPETTSSVNSLTQSCHLSKLLVNSSVRTLVTGQLFDKSPANSNLAIGRFLLGVIMIVRGQREEASSPALQSVYLAIVDASPSNRPVG